MTVTVDECMAKAAAEIDRIYEERFADFIECMREFGATDDEIAAETSLHVSDFRNWRAAELARLRSWLERGGEILNWCLTRLLH